LVINFNNALVGSANAISIAAGALMDNSDVLFGLTEIYNITALDITPPAYVGSTSSNGNQVHLKFDENIYINSGGADVTTYLKTKMSIATDGVNFVPLLELSDLLYANVTNEIYINYMNDMKVILGTNKVWLM
jgi:hypothetical protein